MIDLRTETTSLWRSMSRMTTTSGTPAVMFIGAQSGEGVSSVAASVAIQAATRARRPAWLVDLDLRVNAAHRGFQEGSLPGVGAPGHAFDASFGVAPIYELAPPPPPEARGFDKLMTAHQIEGINLFVTRFRADKVQSGQRVRVRTEPEWWAALRASSDYIIVDAPALDRSSAGLVAAGQMDGVVLVVRPDGTSGDAVASLRREVEAHGGRVLGVVVNGERSDARFAERLFG